jgi:AhpD family alkylhydroperoxidase
VARRRSDRRPYLFRSFPETSKPLIEYHEVLLRGPSPFTEAQRELIAAYVSGLNRCGYCQGIHTATAERLAVDDGHVPRLIGAFETAAITDRLVEGLGIEFNPAYAVEA